MPRPPVITRQWLRDRKDKISRDDLLQEFVTAVSEERVYPLISCARLVLELWPKEEQTEVVEIDAGEPEIWELPRQERKPWQRRTSKKGSGRK